MIMRTTTSTTRIAATIMRTITRIHITRQEMTPWREPEALSLAKLMAWLSPSYPVGAFSYSSGIEWAVETGDIATATTLREWIEAVLREGGGFCDAVFFVHAYRAALKDDEPEWRDASSVPSPLAGEGQGGG